VRVKFNTIMNDGMFQVKWSPLSWMISSRTFHCGVIHRICNMQYARLNLFMAWRSFFQPLVKVPMHDYRNIEHKHQGEVHEWKTY
jgi:hypothetical protein